MRQTIRDAVIAGSVGGVVGGLPSTVHALVTGRDPLEATYAAGRILLPAEERTGRLLVAAMLVHSSLSLGWAIAIARILPRRRAVPTGAACGLAIAALDLGVVGRRIPAIRALHQPAQVADHLLYGAVVGAIVARRRTP